MLSINLLKNKIIPNPIPTNSLYTWGYNGTYGMLGNLSTTNESSPIAILSGVSWNKISIGKYPGNDVHILAIKTDGSLWAWGSNRSGAFGDGTEISKSSPVKIGSSSWSAIAAGSAFSLGILITGALYAWGDNSYGQLGDQTGGSFTSKSSPVKIGSSSWSAIAAGYGFSLGILTTGVLYAWGENNNGALGNLSTTNQSSPVLVSGPAGASWSIISAYLHSLGILTTGALYAWGYNSTAGILGDNTASVSKSSPVKIGSSSWSAIAAGQNHSLGILTTGKLYAWGSNVKGQLGSSPSRSSPGQVGSYSWSYISAGWQISCGISYGKLYAWGDNTYGQLGDGTTTTLSTPTQIGVSNWVSVSCGYATTAALLY